MEHEEGDEGGGDAGGGKHVTDPLPIWPGPIGSPQVRFAQVEPLVGVRLAPGIQDLGALRGDLSVLRVCHARGDAIGDFILARGRATSSEKPRAR
jgi:hypothetical protein